MLTKAEKALIDAAIDDASHTSESGPAPFETSVVIEHMKFEFGSEHVMVLARHVCNGFTHEVYRAAIYSWYPGERCYVASKLAASRAYLAQVA